MDEELKKMHTCFCLFLCRHEAPNVSTVRKHQVPIFIEESNNFQTNQVSINILKMKHIQYYGYIMSFGRALKTAQLCDIEILDYIEDFEGTS